MNERNEVRAMDGECQSFWCSPSLVFERLQGRWHFDRLIEGKAQMSGTATFRSENIDEIFYSERGLLKMGSGQEFEAFRNYIYKRKIDGFSVFFAEGGDRLFHVLCLRLNATDLVGNAHHLCGEDSYVTRYEFYPSGEFRIRHMVEGPRKKYTSDTLFYR